MLGNAALGVAVSPEKKEKREKKWDNLFPFVRRGRDGFGEVGEKGKIEFSGRDILVPFCKI